MIKTYLIIGGLLVGIFVITLLLNLKQESNQPNSTKVDLAPPAVSSDLTYPINDFKNRITKKAFGTYVTPSNSPVQPERFTGYHTGVDVEYGDAAGDVPVYAIVGGQVVSSRTAQGYGGVVVIRHQIDNNNLLVLYGHLDPATMPPIGKQVVKGEQIGILGDAFSAETDGERKHLHFAVLKGDQIDLLGYVQDQSELERWYDPVQFLEQNETK